MTQLFMIKIADRVASLPKYHFVQLEQLAGARQAAGADIINMTVGNPDLSAPDVVVQQLVSAVQDPTNHRYPEALGYPSLLRAFASYLRRRFNIAVDPETEMALLLGSKEGLVYLALTVLDPGSLSLIPDPGYTVYNAGTLLAGAIPVLLPLQEQRGWFPDVASISPDILTKARILWLNYPNNPTGARASLQQLADVLVLAKKYNFMIAYDNAYADIFWDQDPPVSILQLHDAREHVVEYFSFSKTYNMAGFRVGIAVGHSKIINALKTVKSHADSGMFRPIQMAAHAACELSPDWINKRNKIYLSRSKALLEAFRAIGLQGDDPGAGLYLWLKLPQAIRADHFVLQLLDETGIFVTPGTNFGSGGEGYIRVSLTVSDDQIEKAVLLLQKVKTLSWYSPDNVGKKTVIARTPIDS